MAYVAKQLSSYKEEAKTVVGTGHCVPFVQEASGAPNTGLWKRGKLVKGDFILASGTAITFDEAGTYTNSLDGSSHVAIYLEQNALGIHVWDQWKGQPVHKRWIRFQGGVRGVKPVNDGDTYYVIE